MNNLIELEYLGYVNDFKNRNSVAWYVKRNETFCSYINPVQISSINSYTAKCNNGEIADARVIVMSSGEAFITHLANEKILEKINGKPKK